MKLKEWIMARKKKRAAKKREKMARKLGGEAVQLEPMPEEAEQLERDLGEHAELRDLDAEPEAPKSRFTEEYKEFLKAQEAAEEAGTVTREEK